MNIIRVDPLISLVRVYDKEVDTTIPLKDMRESYNNAFTLSFSDDGTVRISGVLRPPSFKECRILKTYLKDKGFTLLTWRHKGKDIKIKL